MQITEARGSISHAHGAGTLEQAGVEIALHVQAVDVRVGVAVAVAAAHA